MAVLNRGPRSRRLLLTTAGTLITFCVLRLPAAAQTAEPGSGLSLGVSVVGNTVRGDQADPALSDSLAVGVSAATFLTPSWTVALEVSIPRASDIGGSYYTDSETRTITEMVLIGFRPQQQGRVRLTYFGGLSFYQLRSRGRFMGSPFGGVEHVNGFAVGLDAAVTVTDRLAIGPLVRVSSGSVTRRNSDTIDYPVRWHRVQWGVKLQWQF